ncbi:DUF2560 family protein [Salmonella enterica subsp. arizonae]|nr:DUF2560 family protein [Salmonella enterica subsp. arizonae]
MNLLVEIDQMDMLDILDILTTTGAKTMADIIPMTEEQKFQLEIYKLVMNQNAAAEEAFQFIGTDELKLELFKIHFQSDGANSDITTRTIEAVRKSKEALDLFTTGA